jgi:hypothetical protein
MKITKDQFKGIVREVMIDESEYQEFFKRALEKAGKSIPDMSDEEKKAFFNKIDAAWDAKGEKNEELTGNQHKLDVDGDGEIEASDLAALRAGKTNEAMASGAWVGLEKTPKGPKLVKTFKSGNEAKAWVMKSPGGHSIMTKKDWDVSEGNSVNEASKKPTIKVVSKLKPEQGIQIVVTKTTKGDTMYGGFVVRGKLQKVIPVGANNSKEGVQKRALQIWDEFGKQLGESVNEDSGPLKLKGIKINKKSPVTFVLEVSFLIGNEVVMSYLTTGTSQDAQKLKSKIEKAFSSGKIVSPSGIGYYAYNESVNEAGDERFDWPPVLDKFKGKEIDKVEAEYKASLDKSSAILDKQRQLIRTTLGNKFEFPWENYDKWPAKLKAEVQKLNSQIDKEREKQPAMFKKLMQARGTWR